jgi:acetolactate synthase I/II/III large subunit
VPLVADAGSRLRDLLEALAARRWRLARHAAVAARGADANASRYVTDLAAARPDRHPPAAARPRARSACLPDDAIVVGDGADVQNWMYGALRIRTAPGFLDHYPLGAMGVGTPLAVGAAAAARELADASGHERPVVLVTGDGSFGFHPAELHAAALARLPLVVVSATTPPGAPSCTAR